MSYRRPRAGAVALIALVIAASAATVLLGDDGDAGERAEAERRVAVEPIKRRVERLRQLRFLKPLDITFVTPEQAKAMIGKVTRRQYPLREQRIDEEELKLLGLLEPQDDLGRSLDAVAGEQVLGFYDDRSKQLVVVTAPGSGRAVQEITLAHELVHALEDQRFGIRSREGFNDDGALAESALFEGTATALMTDYAERYLDLGDLLDVVNGIAGAETKLPAFVEQQLLFPYIEGEKFVRAFRAAGSWRALNKVIRLRRPRTSEQILHPNRYAIGDLPVRIGRLGLGRVLDQEWTSLDATAVGEFDVATLFRSVGAVDEPTAAAGWDGGRLELWRRRPGGTAPCEAPCVRRDAAALDMRWDTAADAEEGEEALRRVIQHGLDGRRVASAGGVGLWASRGAFIALRGSGRRTVVAFAPDAPLAARILRAL